MLTGGKAVFDEDVEYIFNKQLEEAEIIVLNKSDLVDEQTLKELTILLQKNCRKNCSHAKQP